MIHNSLYIEIRDGYLPISSLGLKPYPPVWISFMDCPEHFYPLFSPAFVQNVSAMAVAKRRKRDSRSAKRFCNGSGYEHPSQEKGQQVGPGWQLRRVTNLCLHVIS